MSALFALCPRRYPSCNFAIIIIMSYEACYEAGGPGLFTGRFRLRRKIWQTQAAAKDLENPGNGRPGRPRQQQKTWNIHWNSAWDLQRSRRPWRINWKPGNGRPGRPRQRKTCEQTTTTICNQAGSQQPSHKFCDQAKDKNVSIALFPSYGKRSVKHKDHFDSEVPHLHQKGKTVFRIYQFGGHYAFESYGQQQSPSPTSRVLATEATVKKTRTANEWHSIMAHASHDAIMQLEESSNDVTTSDIATAKVPKTNECETCALTKSHVQISRTSDKSETSAKPFHRVFFDLMQFNTAMNGHRWCSHLACLATNFNLAYTHRHKSETRAILQQVFILIKKWYNGTVVFLRVDGETSLNLDFLDELKELRITYEASTPYIPARRPNVLHDQGCGFDEAI